MRKDIALHRDPLELLYAHARARGRRGDLWSALTGRAHCLLALDEALDAEHNVRGRHNAGGRMVPIEQIQGSEGRSSDFDRDFNPLHDHNRARWLGIATARQRGRALPPVKLVQVGDVYFVRDGHHRISVARALGQRVIEAKVTVWQVAGPLPWEAGAAAQAAGRGTRVGRLFDRMRAHFRPQGLDRAGEAVHVRA